MKSWQRFVGLCMVLLETATVGLFFGRWLFPVSVAIVAVAGQWRLRENAMRDRRLWVVLAATVFILWLVVGRNDAESSAALPDGLGYALIQFFLVAQTYELHVTRKRGMTPLFVLFGAIVMTCAGDVLHIGTRREVLSIGYLAAAVIFLFLASAFWLTGRNQRRSGSQPRRAWVLLIATSILAVAFGAAVSFTLKWNQQELDAWFANLVAPRANAGSVGFPNRAFLHSVGKVKERDSAKVAVRAESNDMPGYLKGLTYDTYGNAEWTLSVSASALAPESAGLERGMNAFALAASEPDSDESIQVWPEVDTHGALFTTLDTVRIQAPFSSLMLDDAHNVANPDGDARSTYILENADAPRSPEPLTEQDRRRCTYLPEDLDPGIGNLAAALFEHAVSTEEKAAAVAAYFRENYQYQLGVEVPDGVDPLAWFLLERPPAHCEFFATGAAVLLRRGGVPCRYVTGFVAAEQNAFGGYWVARNRDAHAWVEAYDEDRGWFIVEATVAEGVPTSDDAQQPGRIGQAWDYVKFLVREVVVAYVVGGIRGVVRWLGDTILGLGAWMIKPVPLVVIVVLVVAVALLQTRRRRARAAQVREPAHRARLHAMLREMDKRVRRQGIERSANETLLRFALRLSSELDHSSYRDAATRWYRDYTRLRFGPTPTNVQLDALDAALPNPSPDKAPR
ncbi:MAG: hypothetical protein AMXMBFR82_08430 [Candidatus Hydrogenedentota bacterium]